MRNIWSYSSEVVQAEKPNEVAIGGQHDKPPDYFFFIMKDQKMDTEARVWEVGTSPKYFCYWQTTLLQLCELLQWFPSPGRRELLT